MTVVRSLLGRPFSSKHPRGGRSVQIARGSRRLPPLALLLVAVGAVASCAESRDTRDSGTLFGPDAGDGEDAGGDARADAGGDRTDGGDPRCLAPGLPPGDTTVERMYGGQLRSYVVYVPPSYDGSVYVPLVVNAHAFTQEPSGQAALSGASCQV